MDRRFLTNIRRVIGLVYAVLGTVLMLAIALGVAFAFRTSQSDSQSQQVVPQSSSPTSTTSITQTDPIAGWNSYSSDKYNFSFRFPTYWIINDCGDVIFLDDYKLPSCGTGSLGYFSVYVQQTTQPLSSNFDDFSSDTWQVQEEPTSVNGISAIRALIKKQGPAPGPDEFIQTRLKVDDKVFTITLWDLQYLELYQTILSTFQFH